MPTHGAAVIHAIWIANTTSSDRTVTIKHIPENQATADGFCLMKGVTVSANTTTVITRDKPIYMREGSKLMAFAAAASAIALTVYGDVNALVVKNDDENNRIEFSERTRHGWGSWRSLLRYPVLSYPVCARMLCYSQRRL